MWQVRLDDILNMIIYQHMRKTALKQTMDVEKIVSIHSNNNMYQEHIIPTEYSEKQF